MKKSRYRGVLAWILALVLGSLTACGDMKVIDMSQGEPQDTVQENSADAEGSDAEGSETGDLNAGAEPEGQQETATVPSTEIVERADSEYDAISNELQAWWFKRNDEHQPSGCQEDFDISQYHAYYVNDKAEDNVIYLTFYC